MTIKQTLWKASKIFLIGLAVIVIHAVLASLIKYVMQLLAPIHWTLAYCAFPLGTILVMIALFLIVLRVTVWGIC